MALLCVTHHSIGPLLISMSHKTLPTSDSINKNVPLNYLANISVCHKRMTDMDPSLGYEKLKYINQSPQCQPERKKGENLVSVYWNVLQPIQRVRTVEQSKCIHSNSTLIEFKLPHSECFTHSPFTDHRCSSCFGIQACVHCLSPVSTIP